ncbi:MAG TPA: DUF2244 domain-containing protein [Alphaproteobacteria bacterium]|nr:DUF2244 domain-containing protein [Alphaproteobacteria bacterium]
MSEAPQRTGDGVENGHAPVLFEARLHPYRSLPPAAFTILMIAVIAVAFAAGAVSIAFGAWPVTGFCGVELLLFYWLFRLNYRSAGEVSEWIRLSADRLEVVRHERNRETGRWIFQPYWLNLSLEGSASEGAGAVLLRSHGRTLALGRFLAPQERLQLKEALAAALESARAPRFE